MGSAHTCSQASPSCQASMRSGPFEAATRVNARCGLAAAIPVIRPVTAMQVSLSSAAFCAGTTNR